MADGGYVPVEEDDEDGDITQHGAERISVEDRLPLFIRSGVIFDQEHDGVAVDQGDASADPLHGHHPKQELHGWASMWLAYQSIGAIYGDIGTSPLYVFSAVFASPPSSPDLLGALSLIIWALILIATIKYVGIVLCANNHGEGGSFALLSLIRRHVKLDWRDSMVEDDDEKIYAAKRLKSFNRSARNALKRSPMAKGLVTILAVLGVCMVMSDGVITPAQSILGAVQGIKIAAPGMPTNIVVALACLLIVFLFAIQPFGVSRLSNFFAPIVMVWLIFNMAFGVYAAFISWHPDAIVNPLFKAVPPGMYWPTLILSILASIVASQAMLTGTFQLISQAIRMAYLPRMRRVHTSKRVASQIYIPLANWLMMAGAIAVTAVFKTVSVGNFTRVLECMLIRATQTTRIGHVYGVCVVGVSFITTWLVALVAIIIWNLHIVVILPVFVFIGFFDFFFLAAALAKIPAGGWFTAIMAAILTSTLLLWSYGEGCQFNAERDESASRSTLFTGHGHQLWLREGKAEYSVKSIRGIGVFLIEPHSRSPPVFDHFIKKFEATHEISVLLQIKPVLKYSVPVKDRFTLTSTNITGLYRVILRYGYGDTPSWDSFEEMLTEELGLLRPRGEPDSQDYAAADDVNTGSIALTAPDQFASQKPITYIIGRDKLYVKKGSGFVRRIILSVFIYLKGHEKTKLSRLRVPVDRLVEVGFSKAI
ncbi:potassium transporter 8 [Coccidioides immitis RMSCC 2394]|uniref:Potassium transporter 8 n=1 Tax=Coccidioides immitis RMSCC 2394 TaxID=404692 RepID=A0A0J6Y0H9_COCIT|nr:potassium transporter 8 [Coccidioides immitis RMSCC 2394]